VKTRTLAAANLLAAIVAWTAYVDGARADGATQSRCAEGLTKARARLFHCWMQKLPLRAVAGGTAYRQAYGKCLIKYDEAWQKLQSLTDTTCVGPRWVDNLDGTVTDHLTGLIWEIKTGSDGIANLADPHDADNLYTISDDGDADLTDDDGTVFTDFLASLNAGAGFTGSTGWRLPSRIELATIITPVPGLGSYVASLDPVFGQIPATGADYLSMHFAPAEPTRSITVVFDSDGLGEVHMSRDAAVSVRAVRGGHF
jgi:hypothetical protein